MREWIDWYDLDHSIYVNARHRDVHFRSVATDILQFLSGPHAVVLDYGCGEALHADLIADARSRSCCLPNPPRAFARVWRRATPAIRKSRYTRSTNWRAYPSRPSILW